MPDPREDEDARLQRLADLSIEIRMLKARVQAVMDDRVPDDQLNGARCPHCGHTAGLALLPREYHRLSTPVRCFSCQRDAIAFEWVGAPAKIRRSHSV